MAYDLTTEGHIGIITMNRAPANAYTNETLLELQRVIDDIRGNDNIHCVVVRSGVEKFFSAGADISTLNGQSPAGLANFLTMAHETMALIEQTPKIFIAEIAGHCIGGGLELALSCDLRFAADAKYGIGLAEVNLGLSPGMGGTQRLPRLIPPGLALHLMITGEMVSAQRALELGIVEWLSPADELQGRVMDYAGKLAEGPSMAQGHIKLSVRKGLAGSLDQGLAYERANQTLLFVSEDAKEGISAFVEKRKAAFEGR